MKLTHTQLITAQQALGYAIMYAKSEHETAEFALLKLDVDSALINSEAEAKMKAEHNKMGCPFQYCALVPKCVGKCGYS